MVLGFIRCSFLDAFLVQWLASERQGESIISLVLVLEHCRKRAHVHLLFSDAVDWDSRVSRTRLFTFEI
jgi:hypothetical protein